MSVGQIHIWVRDRDFSTLGRGSHALKQVLERLSWFADEDGMSVFPKMQTIADALGITKRAVRVRVRALQAKGFVELVEEARQHRPRLYRINVAKILGLPLTETGQNIRDRENEVNPGGKTTSIPDSDAESRGEKYAGQGGKERQPGGKTTSRHIDEESLQESEEESSARASATGPDGGPDAPALETPPACAVWRDHLAALRALPGWPLLERGIPDADDGATLTLAVESPLVGFATLAFARQGAEAALGRRLAVRVRRWVQRGLVERGVRVSGKPNDCDHRREGELVTLDDPAWALWCGHTEELEALACRAIIGDCLPDDIDGGALVLCCNSLKAMQALHEEAGAAVARVLGVAIRPAFRSETMDAALAARGALTRSATVEPETGTG